MLKRLFLLALAALISTVCLYAGQDDGQPFGTMNERDFDAFLKFALAHGVDIEAEMTKAYSTDAAALARVFGLASVFKTMDAQARAYGNLLYSSFLNIVEKDGDDIFVNAVNSLRETERQRVRDFLFYPVRKVPKKLRGRGRARDTRAVSQTLPGRL